MKRILIAALAVLCAFSFWGCASSPESTPENSVPVYYRRAQITYGSADSMIAAYHITPADRTDISALLERYLSETPPVEYTSPFPAELSLVHFENNEYTAKIVLSQNFSLLTGIELSIACTCLTQTVISLTGCEEVIISAENALLDGHRFITMGSDSYLLLDNIPV